MELNSLVLIGRDLFLMKTVSVPETQRPLSSNDLEELLSVIPPLAPIVHYGIDLTKELFCLYHRNLDTVCNTCLHACNCTVNLLI